MNTDIKTSPIEVPSSLEKLKRYSEIVKEMSGSVDDLIVRAKARSIQGRSLLADVDNISHSLGVIVKYAEKMSLITDSIRY